MQQKARVPDPLEDHELRKAKKLMLGHPLNFPLLPVVHSPISTLPLAHPDLHAEAPEIVAALVAARLRFLQLGDQFVYGFPTPKRVAAGLLGKTQMAQLNQAGDTRPPVLREPTPDVIR